MNEIVILRSRLHFDFLGWKMPKSREIFPVLTVEGEILAKDELKEELVQIEIRAEEFTALDNFCYPRVLIIDIGKLICDEKKFVENILEVFNNAYDYVGVCANSIRSHDSIKRSSNF